MNLRNKKKLAARTLNVGSNRIIFLESRINEIKEAITKQDIRELFKSGAIIIKEKKGRKKSKEKRGKRTIKKNIDSRKRDYVIITRKLRKYAKNKYKLGEITKDELKKILKEIRNKSFKSQSYLKKYIEDLKK